MGSAQARCHRDQLWSAGCGPRLARAPRRWRRRGRGGRRSSAALRGCTHRRCQQLEVASVGGLVKLKLCPHVSAALGSQPIRRHGGLPKALAFALPCGHPQPLFAPPARDSLAVHAASFLPRQRVRGDTPTAAAHRRSPAAGPAAPRRRRRAAAHSDAGPLTGPELA